MAERMLLYVFDPLCGWCHAFHRELAQFSQAHPELPVHAIVGGLVTGDRVGPAGEKHAYIAGLLDPMTQRTGVQWGEAFRRQVRDGTLMLDSEAAGRAFVALRRQAPDRAVDIAGALHAAHFMQGKDLRSAAHVRDVAAALGLDPGTAAADWASPQAAAEAQDEFAAARSLGVSGFPTLLLVEDGRGFVLAQGYSPAAEVERRMAAAPASG